MSDEVGASRKPSRDLRRYVYAAVDLSLAALYAVLFSAAPTQHGSGLLLLWSMVGAVVASGLAMLVATPWGRRAAIIGCCVLLAAEAVLLALLVTSAAFLAGSYGAFGKGGALLTLVVALLSLELVVLVPALQLRFLLSRAGRRAFGRAVVTT